MVSAPSRGGDVPQRWPRLLALLCLLLLTGCLARQDSSPLYPLEPHDIPMRVYVINHGWHTGLVVPHSASGATLWPGPQEFPDAVALEVGWGDVDFYQAPTATMCLALQAAFCSRGSVLYVRGLQAPLADALLAQDAVALDLAPRAFAALLHFLDASYARDAQGRVMRLHARMHSQSALYLATGTYSLAYTCNTWTIRALRAAGLPLSDTRYASRVMDQVRPFASGASPADSPEARPRSRVRP